MSLIFSILTVFRRISWLKDDSMRYRQKQVSSELGDDAGVLPLINIVFLLLTFFMVVGQVDKSDPVDVELAQSVSDKRINKMNTAIMYMTQDESIFLNDKEFVSIDSFEVFVQTEPSLLFDRLILKADANVRALSVLHVLRFLKQYGVQKVDLMSELARDIP